jgi:hypothetical protein
MEVDPHLGVESSLTVGETADGIFIIARRFSGYKRRGSDGDAGIADLPIGGSESAANREIGVPQVGS